MGGAWTEGEGLVVTMLTLELLMVTPAFLLDCLVGWRGEERNQKEDQKGTEKSKSTI